MLFNCGWSLRENSWESLWLQGDPTSQLQRKSILNIHWKDWCWSWNSNTWPPDAKSLLIRKDPDDGKDLRREEKGTTEDEMVGWHHQLDGHESEQVPVVDDWQGSLACCSPWGHKESDTTERLHWYNYIYVYISLSQDRDIRKLFLVKIQDFVMV